MAHFLPNDFFALLMTAVALGTDAMSLGMGLGMRRLSRSDIWRISLTIGLFHILMPLAGMALGLYLHKLIGDLTAIMGAVLLIGLGVHMIWDSFKGEGGPTIEFDRTVGWGLLVFATSVSVDALSVGFSFGLSDANLGLAVTLFGIVGALMASVGLSIGSLIGRVLGESMGIVGGAVLILFGIQFLI